MDIKVLILVQAFMVFVGIIAVVMILYADRKKPTYVKEARLIISHKNLARKLVMFEKLYNNFLTRSDMRRIYAMITELSIYTGNESKVIALQIHNKMLLSFWSIIIIGAIAFRDVYATILVFTVALVIKTEMVDKNIRKVHLILLNQLSQSMASLSQTYLRLGSIPDALSECEAKPYVQRSFEDIHNILTSTDSEELLEEFLEASPYRVIQTLGIVSYLIDKFGDSGKVGSESSFVESIDLIMTEIRLDIRKLYDIKTRFSQLQILPLAAIPAIRVVELFLMNNIPGTSVIYNGPLGYILKTVIVLSAILSYKVIMQMNENITMNKDDRYGLATDLMSFNWWNELVKTVTPKKHIKRQNVEKKLKGAMSLLSIEQIYSKKLLISFSVFAISILVFIFATRIGREFIYNNVNDMSLVAGKPLSSEEATRRFKIDEQYLKRETNMSDRDAKKLVDSLYPKLAPYERENEAARLIAKYDAYHNAYFKWWYVLLSYLFAVASWYIPDLFLLMRTKVLQAEATEDVLQLQTLLIVMSYTSVDTLDVIYWMQKASKIHSRLLMEAYQDFPSDPEFTLEKLKYKTSVPEMQRIVDKLMLTINQLTLAEAFRDLLNERQHLIALREMMLKALIEKKRAIASPFAKAPIAMVAILYALLPLGIIGVKEFLNSLSKI